jgi:hypothetical protein
MTMEDWAKHLDLILQADGNTLLTNAGPISAKNAQEHALTEFEKYRVIQDKLFESDFDKFITLEKKLLNKEKKTRCDTRTKTESLKICSQHTLQKKYNPLTANAFFPLYVYKNSKVFFINTQFF